MIPTLLSPNSIAPESRLLLSLLHSNPDQSVRMQIKELLQAQLNWELFNELAVYHRVCPLIADRLATDFISIIDQNHISLILEEALVVRHQAMMLLAEMFRLQHVFLKAGIPCLFIKGPIIALSFYKEFKLRGFRDIDMLVRKQDVPAACRLLDQYLYRADTPEVLLKTISSEVKQISSAMLLNDIMSEISFVGRNDMAIVDLHWRILPQQLDVEDLLAFRHQMPVGKQTIETLEPAANFVITCVHAAKHQWYRLVWLTDIACMLENPIGIDWQRVHEISRIFGMSKTVRASIHIAHILLGAKLPENANLSAPLEDKICIQLKEDIAEFLKVWPTQRGLRHWLLRTWRLEDSKIQAVKIITKSLLSPQIWTVLQIQLPPTLYPLHYFLSPLAIANKRLKRLARRFTSGHSP